jgi:hypothetical protein
MIGSAANSSDGEDGEEEDDNDKWKMTLNKT